MADNPMWSEPRPGDTVERQWQLFSQCIYLTGMVPDQARQIKQAFYSGAWVAFTLASKISALPEETAVVELEKVFKEAEAFCQAAADAGARAVRGRN